MWHFGDSLASCKCRVLAEFEFEPSQPREFLVHLLVLTVLTKEDSAVGDGTEYKIYLCGSTKPKGVGVLGLCVP